MKTLTLTPDDNVTEILGGLREPATVILKRGVYNQKILINADNITLVGEDRETTIITYGDYARKIHEDGKEYNTFRTYSLCVTGDNAVLKNLTVRNSNTDPATVGQCVALSVHSKTFRAENVKLESTQDTLFLAPFPDDLVVRYRGFIPQKQLYVEGAKTHVFVGCEISGTVDFIFGGAEAYFFDCDIVSLKESRGTGYVAAPCHCLAESRGFVFYNCRFKCGGAEKGSVYLARPWRDFGKCVFINCKAGKHVAPELFNKWNDTERDKSARFLYYKLDCALPADPVPWAKPISKAEAKEYISRFEQLNKKQ